MTTEPLYSFGYGLTYTDFVCKNAAVSSTEITLDNEITCTATVENNGTYDGAETVQVYVKVCKEDAPNYQLKALKKVFVKAGEKADVTLTLKPEDFGLYNEEGIKILNKGDYEVYIGTNLPDARSIALTGKTPTKLTLSFGGEDTVIPE